MFVDASVLVAILNEESDANELARRLSQAVGGLYVSPLVRFEAALAISRTAAVARKHKRTAAELSSAASLVDTLIADLQAATFALGEDVGSLAIDAAARFGKAVGHPADLNMGDCFAYACAKSLGVPLLYKGNDFAKTDLA